MRVAVALLAMTAALGGTASASGSRSAAPAPAHRPTTVTFTYAKSPFTDFLYYLLYRSTNDHPQLKTAVPLDGIAPFDGDSFLPQDATLSNVTRYDQLYALAEKHDNPEALKALLRKGEPHFAAFLAFWQAHIAPAEDRAIASWRKEARRWPPVAHLEAMERLKFPFATIRMDVFALMPSGGSMQGPPTIFSTTDIPSLAWAIGHEGTHMMLGKAADWTHRPRAAEASRLMREAGGSDYAIEEALCLLMQAKMSIAAGLTRPDFLTSRTIADSNPSKKLLLALERDWPAYLRNKQINAADFLINETIKTYGRS